MGMTFTVLGCDGCYPSANGACSGYLVSAGQHRLQLDLGCGALPKLMAISKPEEVDALLLTHWHNDHASDLLALKYYLQIHHQTMRLYAPTQDHPLKDMLAGDEFILSDLAGIGSVGGFEITAQAVEHPLPAYAVRIAYGHKSLVYTGDAVGSPDLAAFCQDADLLVCDATFTTAQWKPGLPHFSAAQAGTLAREARVKQLMITHAQPGSDKALLLKEAQSVFPNTIHAQSGLALTL